MSSKIINDFESALQIELDKLPYEKHADAGMYNDGYLDGFEIGALWAKQFFQNRKKMKMKILNEKSNNTDLVSGIYNVEI